MAILDYTGAVAAEYQYDAWGREIGRTKSGNHGENLYKYNALKYRGYYYNADLGLYYVSSRYYDSEVGRFINSDTFVITANGLNGCNTYSYYLNNPVNYVDYSGNYAVSIQNLCYYWIYNMWWLLHRCCCGIEFIICCM